MPLLRVQQVLENLKLKSQNLKLHVKCQNFSKFNGTFRIRVLNGNFDFLICTFDF